MFVLYAFLICVLFVGLDTVFIKTFQLENYKIKKYISKAIRLQFAFGDKTSLVLTKRIKRLLIVDFCLKFACFLLFFGLISNFWVNFSITIFAIVLSPIFVSLSFLLVEPLEILIKKRYIQKAKNKLKNMSCKKIAITGSFGKTSTKNILYQILKEEFDVCATPKSYNTPIGIAKFLNDIDLNVDFVILEYGARHKNDIESLCKLYGADYGIITQISPQHLQTFRTIENIAKAKQKLSEFLNMKPCVFNVDNDYILNMQKVKSGKKISVSTKQKANFYAQNIRTENFKTTFEICFKNQKILCKTNLLGEHNVTDILLAFALARQLKLPVENLQKTIENLQPVPHRLEYIKANINILDDSYNCSLTSAKQSIDVLHCSSGKKMVATPGIIEGGKEQYKINFELGRLLAKIDYVVIVGKTNSLALNDGIKSKNKAKKILFADSLEHAKQYFNLLSSSDTLLLLNDLPDDYI